MRDISNVHAVPILRQTEAHRLFVEQAHTADANCLAVLDTEVNTIIWHNAAVCIQHWSTRAFYTAGGKLHQMSPTISADTTLSLVSTLLTDKIKF